MDIQKMIKDLNPALFGDEGMLIPKNYDVVVVGKIVTKQMGGKPQTGIEWFLTPERVAKTANRTIEPGLYLHLELSPKGSIEVATDENGRVTGRRFRGLTKAKTHNVFQKTDPLLFNFLAEAIGKEEGGKWVAYSAEERDAKGWAKRGAPTAQGDPTLKLVDEIAGAWCTVNTPTYYPQTTGADGKDTPLMAVVRNKRTGIYGEEPARKSYIEFFVGEANLNNVLPLALAEYARRVEGNEVPTVVTTTATPTKTVTEIQQPLPTEEAETLQPEAPKVAAREIEIPSRF